MSDADILDLSAAQATDLFCTEGVPEELTGEGIDPAEASSNLARFDGSAARA
ncbi:MAG TPA: hypothetical protein VID70_06660 [Solirubrobacteraceae bacterium]|jgi:hypothetical protein